MTAALTLASATLAALLGASPSPAPEGRVLDWVAALVNDEVVTLQGKSTDRARLELTRA